MADTIVALDVQEVKGEAEDPTEANIQLALTKVSVPGLSLTGPVGSRTVELAPGLSFFVMSPDITENQVDVQEDTGEEGDPEEANIKIVTTKGMLGSGATVPALAATLYTTATSWALVSKLP